VRVDLRIAPTLNDIQFAIKTAQGEIRTADQTEELIKNCQTNLAALGPNLEILQTVSLGVDSTQLSAVRHTLNNQVDALRKAECKITEAEEIVRLAEVAVVEAEEVVSSLRDVFYALYCVLDTKFGAVRER
jgi:hypothetical protein